MNTLHAAAGARRLHTTLLQWLLGQAYPRWAHWGFDAVRQAFQERLTAAGAPADEPRRARVQTRQVYAYARAPGLGWTGGARPLVAAGLAFFLDHYRRDDGLFRTLVAADGRALDERVMLYDQAFALLALASCQEVLGPEAAILAEGARLRTRIIGRLGRSGGGFDSGIPERLPLLSNPHMHLFEAALAWTAVSPDPAWRQLADALGALALEHLLAGPHGAVAELFDGHWQPLTAAQGQAIEPGHQFEWAWLLLSFDSAPGSRARRAAERLFALGERHGVQRGVAINALAEDLSVKDGAARLWPQTERLKAAARLGALTGEPHYWAAAEQAAATLLRFLDQGTPGLWYDKLTPGGEFLSEPAPASSFYHIVCGIAEFGRALQQAQ